MTWTRRWSVLALAGLLVGCAAREGSSTKAAAKAANTLTVASGSRVPILGVGFVVSHDPATDTVVPGFHILQVGVSNKSINILELNPLADRWFMVDRSGRKRPAILNLRDHAPEAWSKLSPKLRSLIEYPLYVDLGGEIPIDLFFPANVLMDGFRQVIFEAAALGKTIIIYAREEEMGK